MGRGTAAILAMAAVLAMVGGPASGAETRGGLSAVELGRLVDRAEFAARRRYGRRGRGNAAAAAAVVGIAGAVIGGAIAAQERRRYDDEYYDGGYSRYGYGYYGPPGPGWGY